MKSLITFIKKEFLGQIRSVKLIILVALFVLFGIMNPAIAKITPWLFELLEDVIAESGMAITNLQVSAMDSWVQFFKNIPMALIVFVILEGTILTKEYSSGTLILSLTKGLERFKVLISKITVLIIVWSLCYWLCFAITYFGNMLFWDNSIAQNLAFSAICWWLFGMFIISLIALFSTAGKSIAAVLLGTGGAVFAFSIIGLIPKINRFLPTMLTDGNSLVYGLLKVEDYLPSFAITIGLTVICLAVSIPIFNKKQL